MKPLAPNTLLQNRYLIVHLIGKGGMGEVYLAIDQRLGSAVALKRTFFSDDEMLGTAFEREARTLARLRHPVLPKVSDHFTENDLQYLVMEHITGDDLAKRLEITGKPFPLSWVLFWADQLLDALAYLHGHEPPIVHRDIKPQNLKLTDENHIVLLDFGLAKNSVGNTKVSSTTGGSIVGYTPHYAPMEQIRGTGTNPRSDIYSMSATFYQLLCNTIPPDALTRADAVLNGSPDPTKPLFEVNPEIPRAISNVFVKGMALSMEQRYSNAREMQKALREAYAEMQTAMAAQTMAFISPSVSGGGVQNPSIPQSQQQTEQFSTNVIGQMPSVSSASQPATPASSNFNSFSESESQELKQKENFDATLKYDAQPFGEKTEVLPFDKMPLPENYSSTAPQSPQQQENFNGAAAFGGAEEDFNPDATIAPLVNFNGQNDAAATAPQPMSNYDSQPKSEESYTASPVSVSTVAPNQNFNQHVEPAFASIPTTTNSESAKKAGGGKALAIVGGIFGLLFVVVGAAAIGWYALKPKEVTGNPTPAPTPLVEATVAPTAEPTAEPTIEALSTPSTTSTEIVSPTPELTTTNAGGTETPRNQRTTPERPTQQTVVQPTPNTRVAPTPRVVTVKTPPPVAEKTPAPVKTPARSTRTEILQ